MRLILSLVASFMVGQAAKAKLPDASKINEKDLTEVNTAVEQFRKTTVGASPEFRKEAITKLRAVLDKYPDLKALSEKLGKLDPADNIRIAMSGSDQVTFIVFSRATGKETFSLKTTRDMADYYKSGLESNPAKCSVYGCQIIDGQQ